MSGMDTLKAARELRDAGLEEKQAEAIVQVVNEHGRDNLVTKEYLDMRLWQHTTAIAALAVVIAGLLTLIS